ncbi:hypothetical protein LPJ59_006220 [Coemansia sp. RSA 2399]|nr:hypothetical protein LPJ59_006220 [Coemansia sp. RSA 2399]
MFALATKTASPLRQLCARGFASRAIYLGNVNPLTTAEKLQEIFGEFGHIEGIRLSTGNIRYRYAHIYYGAGEPPKTGELKLYMSSHESTPEENAEVDAASAKALEQPVVEIDGNNVYVKESIQRSPNMPNSNARTDGNESVRLMSAYKRGFSDGFAEAKRNGGN